MIGSFRQLRSAKWVIDLLKRLFLYSILIFSLFLYHSSAEAKDRQLIYGGASVNPTYMMADFMGFENTVPVGDPYSNNFSLGFSVFAGKDFGILWESIGLRYDARLAFDMVQSSWSDEYFPSHYITETGWDSLFTNNNYDISIGYLSLRNYFYFPITDDIELAPMLGIGLPITSSFTKSETVARGQDFVFETGTQSRINQSGEIEGLAGVNLGLGLAATYEFLRTGDIGLSAQAEIEYNLNNLSQTESIRPLTSRLGISVALYESKAEPLPVAPKPEPKEPVVVEAPKPEIKEILSSFEVNGRMLAPSDTAFVTKTINRTHSKLTVLPRLFFDSRGRLMEHRYNNLSPSSLSIKEQITDYYAENPDGISLITYDVADAGFQSELYILKAKEQLGIESVIDYEIKTIKNDFDYPELIEEYRRVDILVNGKQEPINIDLSLDSVSREEVRFVHTLKVKPDSLSPFATASIKSPNKQLPIMMKNNHYGTLDFPEDTDKYIIQINDALNDTYVRSQYFISAKEEVIDSEYRTRNSDGSQASQYVLGFNDFDEVNLSFVSQEVLQLARKAVAEGRKVTVLASTDNLGDPEYNRALAERRAREARKLILGNREGSVEILIPDEFQFDNSHPYGRQLNRAILLRIEQ